MIYKVKGRVLCSRWSGNDCMPFLPSRHADQNTITGLHNAWINCS